ncbi:MAG: prepilin-type N-terminal cleavage/methylation domain-containing protein [Candidatus Omnitrophota bacterium]|nr:prepilin-type N-terminal cleavage/methylation domain-containing protein [Candidatus Omnitrophota bacterium]
MISQIKMRPSRKSKRRGFTLLELIFVAVILIIITALTVPQFRGTFDYLQLQNLVSDVVSFARYAQAKAITGAEINRLVFDMEKKSLGIDTYAGVETGDEGAKEIWERIKYRAIPDFISIELQDSRNAVKFYPDGTADKVTMKVNISSGKSFTISIDPLTGYAKAEESPQQ